MTGVRALGDALHLCYRNLILRWRDWQGRHASLTELAQKHYPHIR
jgi:hypothetical protein